MKIQHFLLILTERSVRRYSSLFLCFYRNLRNSTASMILVFCRVYKSIQRSKRKDSSLTGCFSRNLGSNEGILFLVFRHHHHRDWCFVVQGLIVVTVVSGGYKFADHHDGGLHEASFLVAHLPHVAHLPQCSPPASSSRPDVIITVARPRILVVGRASSQSVQPSKSSLYG